MNLTFYSMGVGCMELVVTCMLLSSKILVVRVCIVVGFLEGKLWL